MNNLLSHIEFLLHEHNCVVVPNLGGFVVNVVPSHREGVSDFFAPMCELVFNRDLTHNDGLLAQSYMKTDTLSFEAATHTIEKEVQALKKQLREQRYLELGKLGLFTMQSDEHFIYTPATFIRPTLFGLSKTSLKPLIQLPMPMLPEKRETKQLRKIGVRAAAVAAIVLLTYIVPISDKSVERQMANMLPHLEKSTTTIVAPTNNEVQLILADSKEIATLPKNETQPIAEVVVENQSAYSIVIGVFSLEDGADRTVAQLKANGIFTNAEKVARSGKFYVTAASFADRSSAEVRLREIHRNHSAYADAWILKR